MFFCRFAVIAILCIYCMGWNCAFAFYRFNTCCSSKQLCFTSSRTISLASTTKKQELSADILNRLFPATLKDLFPLPNAEQPDAAYVTDPARLEHPLLDLNLEKTMRRVVEISKIAPGPRTKPLMATVRGSGGGKTRLVEELRKAFLATPSSYAIAITFNSAAMIAKSETFIFGKDMKKNFQLACMVRIAAAHYHIPFDAMRKYLHDTKRSDTQKLLNTISATNPFFQTFFKHILMQSKPNISTFVFMIDEIVLAEKEFYQQDVESVTDYIKSDVLNSYILPYLNTTLLISSLAVESVLHKISSREVETITLPEQLNRTAVLHEWLLRRTHTNPYVEEWQNNMRNSSVPGLYENELYKLELLISLCNSLPLTTEFLIKSVHACMAANTSMILDEVSIQQILQDTFDRIKRAIPVPFFPSPSMYFALLFERFILYNDDSKPLIQASLFVNSLSQLKINSAFIPRTVIPILLASTYQYHDDDNSVSKMNAQLAQATILGVIDLISSHKKDGDMIGELGKQMMDVRYHAARLASRSIHLADLIGVDIEIRNQAKIKNMLSMPIACSFSDHVTYHEYFTSIGKNQFQEFLEAISVNIDAPVHVVYPHPDDPYDLLMIFYDARKPATPLVLFMDFKNRVPLKKDDEGNIPNMKQFEEVEHLCQTLDNSSSESKNNIIDSLTTGNYLYVTMSTYHGNSFSVQNKTNLLIANEKATKVYFSFFYPLYQALRSSLFRSYCV